MSKDRNGHYVRIQNDRENKLGQTPMDTFIAFHEKYAMGGFYDGFDEEGNPCFEIPMGNLEYFVMMIHKEWPNYVVSIEA